MQIRAHELAKELKISTMALKKHLTEMGVIIRSHMSQIEEEVADKIRRKYNEQMDAEKKAEKDRKRLAEIRQAAKVKHEEPAKPEKPEIQVETDELEPVEEEEQTAPTAKHEPERHKPQMYEPPKKEAPKHRIIVPYTQATPVVPRSGRERPRPGSESPDRGRGPGSAPGQRPGPRTGTGAGTGTDRPRPETRRPGEPVRRRPETETPKPLPVVAPTTEEAKKFGKAKVSHEELGDKSKHKKAILTTAKKGKKPGEATPVEDEAQISRKIKKIMQKSGKKKKYHREAQMEAEVEEGPAVIREFTSVSELAKIMGVTPAEIISKFFAMGQLVTMNQRLDKDSLEMICDEFKVEFRFEDEFGADIIDREKETYKDVDEISRPPVVTIMGHVDHGKTSILDYIRNTNIVAGESGGITQHIGAYQIEINKNKITFLDTPGHEAFTAMRARGANITDIAVIVVAANEGMKPQTKEAIDHAKAAGVKLIIAINKIDLPDANIDKVVAQLLDYGVFLEQYGGDVSWVKTSVVTGEGVLNLIEVILLTAEMMDLKAKQNVPATAVVIESEMDTRMGSIATLLIQEGVLNKGDVIVCGATHGKIRKIENERGQELKHLNPSDVGRIFGLNETPKAGDVLKQVDTERTARSISSERKQINLEREKFQNKSTLHNIFARIQEDKVNSLNVVLKTDTDGSAEVLADALQKLENQEVAVNIIRKSVGGINEADVNLASASDALIVGFHVRASQLARKLAEDEGVQIKIYQVIYEIIDDITLSLQGMLKPVFEERVIGSATIKQVFRIKKIGTIAGCQVDSGSINSGCKVRLYRNDVQITEDTLSSLKHYANDVKEVKAGTECGLSLTNFSDIKEGDVLEFFVMDEVVKKL